MFEPFHSIEDQLRVGLPEAAFRPLTPLHLEEPRGRYHGRGGSLIAPQPVEQVSGGFTDHFSMPLLHRLNSELADTLSGDGVGQRLDSNIATLEELAAEIEMVLQAETNAGSEHSHLKGLAGVADYG